MSIAEGRSEKKKGRRHSAPMIRGGKRKRGKNLEINPRGKREKGGGRGVRG